VKILLIEDNETLAKGVSKKLKEIGYIVDIFNDGEDGLYAIEISAYDLLILDLGLPIIDGIEIIKRLRSSQQNLPILVISARDKLDQRILGLSTGADDYLCKPFELDEVIARVQALLRRSKNQITNIIAYNDLLFNTQTLILTKESELIDLSKRELKIFQFLLQNQNAIVSKDNIVDHITTIDDEFNPTAIETYISRLRKKLGDSINIKTVRGLGYIMS
jgi:DNA-binding response OmpR family regulator